MTQLSYLSHKLNFMWQKWQLCHNWTLLTKLIQNISYMRFVNNFDLQIDNFFDTWYLAIKQTCFSKLHSQWKYVCNNIYQLKGITEQGQRQIKHWKYTIAIIKHIIANSLFCGDYDVLEQSSHLQKFGI